MLELSDQMIAYWSSFQRAGEPNAAYTPAWPRYRTDRPDWMVLDACETDPASTQPPAACSRATTAYAADHKFDLWSSVLG